MQRPLALRGKGCSGRQCWIAGPPVGEIERMTTKTKEEDEVETEREATPDGPLLDLSDDAVKKMIKAAKKRGYVTMDDLNAVLPSEEVTSEQIEDTMSMLSDMGINVIEDDEAGEDAEGDDAEDPEESKAIAETSGKADRKSV